MILLDNQIRHMMLVGKDNRVFLLIIVRSLKVKIVTQLTKAPNFAQG